jgi:hypothetical protein
MPFPRFASPRFRAAALAALCLLPAAVPALPGPARGAGLAQVSDYTATLDSGRLSGTVGREVELTMTLSPPVPPAGYFVTVLVTPLEVPEGAAPTILPGFPVTVVVPRAPGRHRFGVRVNMITKSSCGGVEAHSVLDAMATLDAAPAPAAP